MDKAMPLGYFSRAGAVLCLLSVTTIIVGAGTAAAQPVPDLLLQAPAQAAAKLITANPSDDSVVRRLPVTVNQGALGALKSVNGGTVRWNLFDDLSVEVEYNRLVSQKAADQFVLIGNVAGRPEAESVLVVNKEATVADIRMPGGDTYQIRYRGNGISEALHVLEGKQDPCGVSEKHHVHGETMNLTAQPDASENSAEAASSGLDSETDIRVLVVYTAQAQANQGGESGMNALITLAETYANEAYANSAITPRISVVHREMVSYTETGDLGIDLNAVTETSDGKMDNVHALRNTHAADMACLFVSEAAGGACGIGWLMENLTTGFAPHAFAVCANNCVSNQTFAHELGHNMGCAHARPESASGSGLYSYSHGHRWTGSNSFEYRSVMAYAPGTRVKYFSNPAVTHMGAPTGVASGNASTEANNAMTIANSASTIANFRVTAPGVANDNFANRITISGISGTVAGNNAGATKEPGEPNHGVNGGASVWWTWTAPASGEVTFNTSGSGFDTGLGIYTGDSVAALVTVATNDDDPAGGTQSKVTFQATAGMNYRVAVDGFGGASGSVTLNWDLEVLVPNDSFANRMSISGASGSTTGNNIGATKETGEPNHGNAVGGASIWWNWTAPASGQVEIDTFSSSFDTLLGVYTGESVAALTVVAQNDDFNSLQSRVSFQVTSGVNYKIAVDGFGAATGNVLLNWALIPQACTYSVSPAASPLVAGSGGGDSFSVTAGSGCLWTAIPEAGWVTLTGGHSGDGNGTVTFTVEENNTGSQRTTTISVGGQAHTVTQAASCSFSVAPNITALPASGGTGTVTVTATGGCSWTATSNADWVILSSGSGAATGTGSGAFTYTVVQNLSSSPRSTTITIAGQTISVQQDGLLVPAETWFRATQQTRVSSSGGGYQELIYNYTTSAMSVTPYQSSTGLVNYNLEVNEWMGIYHYDYDLQRFSEASYKVKMPL